MSDSEHFFLDNQLLQKNIPLNSNSIQDRTDFPQGFFLGQPDDEILELGNRFDLNGFQVVRREFFAHTNEPSVTFNNCRFYVNTACIQRFPQVESVQVLVNKETRILAIMPCPANARDSFAWCSATNGRRRPKQITCRLFFAKIFSMMGWNPDYRYKILGKLIHANGEYLIAFDLSSTEIYQRTVQEGVKAKSSRTPVFPAEWQHQFGLPYKEHQQSMQVNILDGYAVYSIKDTTIDKESSTNVETTLSEAVLSSSKVPGVNE